MVPAGGDVDGAAVCVGCTVELHGLTKASLNGARGVIVSYDAERARFGVSGVGDGVIAVKPENLQRVDEPTADEAEEAATTYTEPDGDELLECARYGELAELGQLLDLGTDPDFRDAGHSTALHRACANGHVAIIERLASAGAGHVANAEGNTPLHWAVQQGQADAVHTLLRLYPSIDVLAQNSFGRSASTEAFAKDDTRIVEALLSHSSAAALEKDGADLGADEYADSPAYHAEETHAFAFGPPADAVGGASPPSPPVCVRELGSLEADGTDAILGTTATLDRTGLQLWAAAVVMGRWLADLSPVLARRSVLELGAGCGLCGIVAARVCGAASVLLTDLAEHTLDNLRHNVEINPGGGTAVAALDWEKPDSWPAEPFEVIIGSDLIYAETAVRPLVATILHLLERGGAFFYVAPETNRQGEAQFLAALVDAGFRCDATRAPLRYVANRLVGRSDDEFNALFAELSQRTYTLYCFTREADGKAEAAADEAGARRSAAAIARERSAVSIGQFIAEAAAVVGAHGR